MAGESYHTTPSAISVSFRRYVVSNDTCLATVAHIAAHQSADPKLSQPTQVSQNGYMCS